VRQSLCRRTLVVLLAAVMLAALAGGCSKPVVEQALVIAQGAEVTTLETHQISDSDSVAIRMHIYDNLVRVDDKGVIQPALAEKWEFLPDGKSVLFTLRKNVKFHDGTPFNATAVKKNFNRLLDPERNTGAKSMLNMIAAVEVVDEYHVKISTAQPFGAILMHLAEGAGSIMSPAAIEQYGDDVGVHPVGTGPFKFVEWIRGDRVVVERNNEYWGPRPALTGITWRIVPDDAARLAMLETGEADVVVRVPPFELKRMAANESVKLINTTTNRSMYFILNLQKPPFNDIRVRQAVNMAVDRQAIIDTLLQGQGKAATAPITPGVFGYAAQTPFEFSVDKAKALLKDAGYTDAVEITLAAPQGRYLMDRQIAEAVAGQLEAAGFKVKLNVVGDFPAYLKILANHEFDMAYWGWAAPTLDADIGMRMMVESKTAGKFPNFGGYVNPQVDSLVQQGASSLDAATRSAAYGEACKLVWADAPWCFMFDQAVTTGVRSNVSGVVVMPSEWVLARGATKK